MATSFEGQTVSSLALFKTNYFKKIPKDVTNDTNDVILGAAIEDGTLKPGDRLLEVNNVCVDGMSQSQVVTLLKSFPTDSTVNLQISRHAIADEASEKQSPNKVQESNPSSAVEPMESAIHPGRKLQFQLDKDDKTDEEVSHLEPFEYGISEYNSAES